jgi:hypothetical protein
MVRLMLLAGAWVLMRRYVFRRRIRIQRETFVSRMTAKLRALAAMTLRRSAAPKRRQIPGWPAEIAPRFDSRPAKASASSSSSSAFRSPCRQRAAGFAPGP